MGSGPLVTVGIPTYGNRARFLGKALRSVLGQTVRDIEVFVSNDGSIDETPSVVASFQDQRVHYLDLPRPGGLHANLNRCLRLGGAPFVAICQDDDLWMPTNLERLLDVMDTHPAVGLVHGAFSWIGPTGELLRNWSAWSGWRDDTVESGEQFIRRSMSSINRINMSSALMRRSVLGGERFQEEDGPLCDTGMWLRLARRGDVAFVSEPLTALRIHPDSASVREGINDTDLRGTTSHEVRLAQEAKQHFLTNSGYRRGEIRKHRRVARRWAQAELLRIVTRRTSPERSAVATAELLWEATQIEPSLVVSPRTWRVLLASMAGRRGRRLAHRLLRRPRPMKLS